MADILPFNGLRYNKKKVKNFNKVFAPPYDVISESEQKKLYAQHPENIIRLILGKISKKDTVKNNRYTRAANMFSKWIGNETFIQDSKPSIYVYTQDYIFEGRRKKRIGFVARLGFDDKKGCLPHEHTLLKPKEDRVKLIRAVKANLSPIFSFYIDRKNEVQNIFKTVIKRKPLVSFKDKEKITHHFWKVDDASIINKVQKLMKNKQTFIADGHHRYEVSMAFRDEMLSQGRSRKENFNSVMMYFTGFNEENLSVMPTHRLVKNITGLDKKIKSFEDYFKIEKFKNLNDSKRRQKKAGGFS